MSVERFLPTNLNKWTPEEKPKMEEFNRDNELINAALQGKSNSTHLHTGVDGSGKIAYANLSGAPASLPANGGTSAACSGNAATATKLQTIRTINGVNFDGTTNITLTAAANGGTSAACSGNAATATKLQTARTINGVSFDGSTNITVTAAANGGNAATATKLQTARTINGVNFDGSANITVTAAANGGNAATATALQTARTIAIGTGATGTATSFNGSAPITIPITAINPGYISAGTFGNAMIAQTNANYTIRQVRNVIESSGAPSGGANGDIWLKYI